MDEIVKIITDTEGADEQKLIDALKSSGKDEQAVQAALSVYRTMSAFRDSLDESDLASIAKSLDYKAAPAQEAPKTETAEADVEATKAEDAVATENGSGTATAVNAVLEELRKELTTLKNDKRRAEFATKVADVKIGKSTDELVKMLETIDDAGGDVNTMVETLKSVSTIADRALFSEIGSGAGGQGGDEGYEAVKSAAREIAAKDNISFEKGLALVHERRPEVLKALYNDK